MQKAAGVLSWIASLLGELWAYVLVRFMVCCVVGGGHKPDLSIRPFIFPVLTVALSALVLRSGPPAQTLRARNRRWWMAVPPLYISAVVLLLVVLA